MSRTSSFLASLMLLPSLAVLPLVIHPAGAQEAIMLETIGAVRMAPPQEVQRRASEDALRQQPVETARSVSVPARRADAAN